MCWGGEGTGEGVQGILLAVHNKKEHSIDEQTAHFSEIENEITKHECKQCPAELEYLNELQRHIEENRYRKENKKKLKNKNKEAMVASMVLVWTVLHPLGFSGVLVKQDSGVVNWSGVLYIALNKIVPHLQ